MIPLYILTGYLGAGKTTLLKSLLRQVKREGRTPAVLMNEFGSESVDTLLLQGTNVPVVDMLEGCVCCTLKGTLPGTLAQMVDGYRPDVIFLETTGVANPIDLLKELAAPELQGRVQVMGVWTSVSARRFPMDPSAEQTLAINEKTMLEQARAADVLLVSKTDMVTPEKRDALVSVLRGLNAEAPLFEVIKGNVDVSALFAVERRERKTVFSRSKAGKVTPVVREKQTSFGELETLHYEFCGPVEEEKLVAFLNSLPANVVRAKGFFVRAENGRLQEFHFVPPAPVEVSELAADHGKRFAVIIGEKLEQEVLKAQLAACEVVTA